MNQRVDVVVVGAGIAGLTAALYCARQKLNVVMISIDMGGQLMMASDIRNYPGFVKISGAELALNVLTQVEDYRVNIVYDGAESVETLDDEFVVRTSSGESYSAKALILAIGKSPRELGVPGESVLKGRGVSYCVICDGPLFRNKTVALYGWGQHALEGVMVLKDYAKKIYWIYPQEAPYGLENLQDALAAGKLILFPGFKPVRIDGSDKVSAIVVEDKLGYQKRLEVDGVFVEAGYVTKSEFLRGVVELNEQGEVVVDKLCQTSRRGIFAAGDITDMPYKQAVISAGQGAIAALSAFSYLTEKRGKRIQIKGDWGHI